MGEIILFRGGVAVFMLLLFLAAISIEELILLPLVENMWQEADSKDPAFTIKKDLYYYFKYGEGLNWMVAWMVFPEFTLIVKGLKKLSQLILDRYIEHKYLEIQRKEFLGKSD